MITESSLLRLRRALTSVGMEHYESLIKKGLTPRQAIRQMQGEEKEKNKLRAERNKQIFIEYGLPIAKMSVDEYILSVAESARKRWDGQKQIIKNWKAKTLGGAVLNYLNFLKENYKDKNNPMIDGVRYSHIKMISEAIFRGLDYDKDAAEFYKEELIKFSMDEYGSLVQE